MPSSYSALFSKEVSELSTGEQLSYKETVDFYWYFLRKYVSATKSKRQSKSLLPWAIFLASHNSDAQVAFGPSLLALTYSGLSNATRDRLSTASLPYWLIQRWGEAYFPGVTSTINHSKGRETGASISIDEYIDYLDKKDNVRQRKTYDDRFPFFPISLVTRIINCSAPSYQLGQFLFGTHSFA